MPRDCVRLNGGTGCDVEERPFARGSFKKCHRGTYKNGERRGEKCVVKEFNDGSVYEGYYFRTELQVVNQTIEIVENFNNARVLGRNMTVLVNKPLIGTGLGSIQGVKCMVEPYIENFEKFNSNSGWVNPNSGEWGDAIQALSHFSYHYTNGRYLLCDLQGGTYRNGL